MKHLLRYSERLGLSHGPSADIGYLTELHKAHFYSVPFENLSMIDRASSYLSYAAIADDIVGNKRGGICFEYSVLLEPLLEHVGFSYRIRLARLFTPVLTPATHQLFIISTGKKQWIFDVGFGAKGPRAPLLLQDGYEHSHSFLSSRVRKSLTHGWIVSVKENSKPEAVWEDIYAFHDIEVTEPDINMAYFYTLHSPDSLLKTNKVASLPTENGRISIRNKVFTEVEGLCSSSIDINSSEELSLLLSTRFGINIAPQKLTHM